MSVSEVVKDQFVENGNPGVGRAIVIGAIIGVVFAFVGVGALCLVAGYEWTTALGLGAFASIWSGLGFGFMFGGIIYVTKLEVLEKAEREAARAQAAADPASMSEQQPGSSTLA